MSHGSKKWITAYDGTIKRSNDRTKKDYYRGLKWWDDYYYYRNKRFAKYYWHKDIGPKDFCPQCKHVQKYIRDEEKQYQQLREKYEQEYDGIFGETNKLWKEYRNNSWKCREWLKLDGTIEYIPIVFPPKIPEPPHFYKWTRDVKNIVLCSWDYDVRSYLCFKCERKYETKQKMWWQANIPGKKARYRDVVSEDRRQYRTNVKHVMNRAKYDEEYYDKIPKYKRGWLD